MFDVYLICNFAAVRRVFYVISSKRAENVLRKVNIYTLDIIRRNVSACSARITSPGMGGGWRWFLMVCVMCKRRVSKMEVCSLLCARTQERLPLLRRLPASQSAAAAAAASRTSVNKQY